MRVIFYYGSKCGYYRVRIIEMFYVRFSFLIFCFGVVDVILWRKDRVRIKRRSFFICI